MFSRICVIFAVAAVLCSAADYKKEFTGKVALVTGGSSGIGFKTALEFARNGAKVIITARDEHPKWFSGDVAAKQINDDLVVKQSKGSARFFKADMSDLRQVKALFDDIRKKENDLHFAVNSAGISGPIGKLEDVRQYINGTHCPVRNNIYATIFSLMYETRFITEKKHGGAIVNLASESGLKATPKGSLYGASKFGIIGLSRSVAAEYAAPDDDGSPVIRINAVAPSLTDTSLTWQQVKTMEDPSVMPWEGDYITPTSELWKRRGEEMIKATVSTHIASPKNIAEPILWLCSSEASYITGSVFSITRGSIA